METIQVNIKEAIEKTIDNHVNQQMAIGGRREWQLHVFFYPPDRQGNPQEPNAKIVLHQDGNYYPPEVRNVNILSMDDLFEESAIDDIPSFNDDYSDSRKEFMKDHDLESMDDLDENMQKEYDELLDAYQNNTMEFAESTLSAGRKDTVSVEDAEGVVIAQYKIEWV